jgi:signal transduction histidine kinase
MSLNDSSSTEAVSLQRRLELVTAELESSQAEAYQFARSLAHDLAAPLTSTRWLLETLRDQPSLPAESKGLVENAIRNLEQMAGLVSGITAHAEVGRKSVYTLRAASTERAMERALTKLATAVKESGAEIRWQELPPVPVEPEALTSLLQNLLSNAIKFRRSVEPPRIVITAVSQDARWVFRVQDNGIGIDERQFSRVFQPLQRLNPDIPGRGIGLATCRKIVERTGGRIWIESVVGQGSSFLFTLPKEGPTGTDTL